MNPLSELGKLLVFLGIFSVVVGLFLIAGPKIPFLGRLPGDIVIRHGNFTFYFPWVTCIVLSIVLTLIFSIFRR